MGGDQRIFPISYPAGREVVNEAGKVVGIHLRLLKPPIVQGCLLLHPGRTWVIKIGRGFHFFIASSGPFFGGKREAKTFFKDTPLQPPPQRGEWMG